jgi:hypothetical protein
VEQETLPRPNFLNLFSICNRQQQQHQQQPPQCIEITHKMQSTHGIESSSSNAVSTPPTTADDESRLEWLEAWASITPCTSGHKAGTMISNDEIHGAIRYWKSIGAEQDVFVAQHLAFKQFCGFPSFGSSQELILVKGTLILPTYLQKPSHFLV